MVRSGKILLVSLCLLVWGGGLRASAQFKENAFSQSYNDDKANPKDSVDAMFSFKEYFGGLGHKNEMQIGTMFAGSCLIPGGCQIYNKQYWKLPLVYGGILGSAGAGIALKHNGNDNAAKWCFIGAGAAYWATLMDGVVSYKTEKYPLPGKSTLYSLLLPGLGQAYNGEYWKIPIYITALGAAVHFYSDFATNYTRWAGIYKEITDPEISYSGPANITADAALYYRNYYRRYRDYCVLAIGLVYLLQVIDANVFSYMHSFDVSDDLAVSVSPTVIVPHNEFALNPTSSAFGVRFGISF